MARLYHFLTLFLGLIFTGCSHEEIPGGGTVLPLRFSEVGYVEVTLPSETNNGRIIYTHSQSFPNTTFDWFGQTPIAMEENEYQSLISYLELGEGVSNMRFHLKSVASHDRSLGYDGYANNSDVVYEYNGIQFTCYKETGQHDFIIDYTITERDEGEKLKIIDLYFRGESYKFGHLYIKY